VTIGDTMPDLTIILDVPVAQGMERITKRRGNAEADRFEAEAVDFHKKLRESYLELAEHEPARCVPVDASGDPQSVANAVWAVVNARLNPTEAPMLLKDAGLVSADIEVPHPRQTHSLFGHAEAEQAFLDAYKAGRMPHAWLIGGPRGIGKATLAYRMARFVLAASVAAASDVQRATSLALAARASGAAPRRRAGTSRSARRLSVRSAITTSLRAQIAVDDVRRTIGFFGSTAGEGGWRVCVVDAADELNAAGANALLKILEEPPEKALLIVVSHAPAACCRPSARAAGVWCCGRCQPRRSRGRSPPPPVLTRPVPIWNARPRPPTAASRARSRCLAARRSMCARR